METGSNLDTANKSVSILLDTLTKHGVRDIVCSPGSRNTPLLIGASMRYTLKITMVVDERAAAFVALGKALISRKPVALCCTSGTAPLNYSPALAEAFYAGIPLIAITADRPSKWIDQDDSQTIRQQGIFSNFVKRGYDLSAENDNPDNLWYVGRLANEGMLLALSPKQGPIHFNIHLDNPLGTISKSAHISVSEVKKFTPQPFLSWDMMKYLAQETVGKKILIVAGYGFPNHKLNRAISEILRHPGFVIMAETISNIKIEDDGYYIDAVLSRLSEQDKSKLRPDIVISFGGAIVSRMLKEFLRNIPGLEHWHISNNSIVADCFKSISKIIDAEPSYFIHQLHIALSGLRTAKSTDTREEDEGTSYQHLWHNKRIKAIAFNKSLIKKAKWSDLKAFDIILNKMPKKVNLFLSNGTPIRYDQIVTHPRPHATYCNRGVSGIDGCTSTAVGASTEYGNTTLLISGDMSFAYDIAALGTRLADNNFRLIVMKNGGGGIFRFISTTSSLPMREEYFCADNHPPIEKLAKAYNWIYLYADSESSLLDSLEKFWQPDSSPKLLEIATDPEKSAETLKNFLKTNPL